MCGVGLTGARDVTWVGLTSARDVTYDLKFIDGKICIHFNISEITNYTVTNATEHAARSVLTSARVASKAVARGAFIHPLACKGYSAPAWLKLEGP